jgi:hypothetical protein
MPRAYLCERSTLREEVTGSAAKSCTESGLDTPHEAFNAIRS